MNQVAIQLTAIEQIVADQLGFWLDRGYRSGAWYECLITGKKFRGDDAKQMFTLQAKLVAQEEIQSEVLQSEYQSEPQEHISLPLEDNPAPSIADNSPEPTEGKKKARKRKLLTLDEVQVKYPHVDSILTVEFTDAEMNNKDYMGLLQTKVDLQGISDSLADWLCLQMDTGKSDFRFYRIKCGDCKEYRVIKPQDAFQVKYCLPCSKARYAERRRKSAK